MSYEHGRRRGGDFVATAAGRFLQLVARPRAAGDGTNMTTWVRNVDQFRRFDVADRAQNILNVRFNHGIGSTIDASVGLQVKDLDIPTRCSAATEHSV